MNTTDFLSIATAICPERDCVVFEGERYSYARINDRVNQLAHALDGMGVKKGERIGMLSVNCNQHVEAYFATAKLGGIDVPLNFRSKAEELGHMIDRAEIKVLFAGSRYMDPVDSIRAGLPKLERVISVDGNEKDNYEELIAPESADEIMAEIGDEDVTMLMFTSGTTGRPKAVPLRHDSFVVFALENVEPANPDLEERNILTVPLYHVAGIQAMLPAIYGGRTLIMMRQFDLKEWMETVQREKATRAMLVPTMLKWIVDNPDFDKYDLSSLNVITYGAAPMPFEVIKKAIEMMPRVRFINGYGQTESASTLTTLGPEDHRIVGTEEEKQKKWKRLRISIGKSLPDVAIRIVDEQGRVVPPNTSGRDPRKGPPHHEGLLGG